MRLFAVLLALTGLIACSGGLFRQYEYEEELYLELDGTGTLYVNSSLSALNALRGTSFEAAGEAAADRAAVEAYYNTPVTHVTRFTESTRRGRRFVHVRLAVSDVTRLGEAAPFSWSAYDMKRDGELVVYRQTVTRSAETKVRDARWQGDEIVAFRLHAPSRVVYHTAGADNLRRGNILVWEQSLTDRLGGRPIEIDVKMEPESILHRTLLVFGAAAVAALLTLGGAIWWIARRR